MSETDNLKEALEQAKIVLEKAKIEYEKAFERVNELQYDLLMLENDQEAEVEIEPPDCEQCGRIRCICDDE